MYLDWRTSRVKSFTQDSIRKKQRKLPGKTSHDVLFHRTNHACACLYTIYEHVLCMYIYIYIFTRSERTSIENYTKNANKWRPYRLRYSKVKKHATVRAHYEPYHIATGTQQSRHEHPSNTAQTLSSDWTPSFLSRCIINFITDN